ncbi:MAG: NAD(P)-binding domain-containing protein [Bacteroidota bacterium]
MKYLIIGAGPAGIAAGVALKQAKIPFEIVDAGDSFGGIWDIGRQETPMYQSAHFISSKTLSGFQDFPMPDHYPDYPNHSLVLSYIQSYAERHHLSGNARFCTKVLKVVKTESLWEVTFENYKTKTYSGVICVTGITWELNYPEVEGKFAGEFIHSFDYKEDELFKGKKVLVIGAGNSGCDIACDAARTAEKAFISMRRGYYFIPKYTLGIPSDLYKERFGIPIKALDRGISQLLLNKVFVGNLKNYGLQKPDHKLMESHPIMNSRLLHYLGHGDIKAKPNVVCAYGNQVTFQDGTTEEVDLIVAATGYKRTFPFLDDTLLDIEKGKEPSPYLQIFSRKFDTLFFMGGIEVSAAVFALFNQQAKLIAAFIGAKNEKRDTYKRFVREKVEKKVNLRGNNTYIDTQRHQRYVDKKQYQKILKQQLKTFTR